MKDITKSYMLIAVPDLFQDNAHSVGVIHLGDVLAKTELVHMMAVKSVNADDLVVNLNRHKEIITKANLTKTGMRQRTEFLDTICSLVGQNHKQMDKALLKQVKNRITYPIMARDMLYLCGTSENKP
jgi:hypothetical protein